MYIGILDQKNLCFTHADSTVPFPPTSEENGIRSWDWESLLDTALDLCITLEKNAFVGALALRFSEKRTVSRVEALVDGKIVGEYHAQSGATVGGEITLPIGVLADTITVRLYADMNSITLESIEVLGAYNNGKPFVWPVPKNMTVEGEYRAIGSIVAASDDPDEQYATRFLGERLAERHGILPTEGDLRIVFEKNTAPEYANERYTVRTCGNTVTVTAASRLPLLYGADTLLQLSQNTGLPAVTVDDAPSKPLRGLHIGLPAREKIAFTKRLFRYLMVPLRYNFLIVEFAGGMRFDRHPEISEGWLRARELFHKGEQPMMPHSSMVAGGGLLEKHEVRDLFAAARELGVEIVPEVQSFGHVQYITYAHPELAERIETPDGDVDARADDVKPVGFYPHCYCPSLDASYELIYDIIDEIVEVTQPERYVHMGHDEIYHIGRCHVCQTKRPEDLYVKHVTAMYEHLKKKGLGMMLWSDMLHPDPNRKYYVPEARERLPRDILMLDFSWYFRPELDIEDELLPYGYQLIAGNLYSSHYTRYRARMTKDGMLGGQISLWLPTEELASGDKGKWWDMIYLSEMLWNPETYDERNRETYTHLIAAHLQPLLRGELRGTYAPNGYRSTDLELPNQENRIFAPLSPIAPHAQIWENGTVTANACYDRLVFAHATAWGTPISAWDERPVVGNYVVTYEDGTCESVPVIYAQNIMRYNHRYGVPQPHKYYRHTGYVGTWFSDPVMQGAAADGTPLTVTGYVWENPYPSRKIASIGYQSVKDDIAKLILVGICGQNQI